MRTDYMMYVNWLMRWGPAILWMLVIYVFSDLPKLGSGDLIPDFAPWDFEVKKTGHFCAYGLLGVLMLRGLRGDKRWRWRDLYWALALTVAYAGTDEYHQTFVTGRHGQLADLLFDFLGASAGLLFRAGVGSKETPETRPEVRRSFAASTPPAP